LVKLVYVSGAPLAVMGITRLAVAHRQRKPNTAVVGSFAWKALIAISLAVSTDAFIAGFSFGVYGVPIAGAVTLVAAVTVVMSVAGTG